MIREITIESDKIAMHTRRMHACDRCSRSFFVTIWRVDGKIFELCDHCVARLDGHAGVDVVRALRIGDRDRKSERLKNLQAPPRTSRRSRRSA